MTEKTAKSTAGKGWLCCAAIIVLCVISCFAQNGTYTTKKVLGLLGAVGGRFTILAPFWCDYGCNTFMGRDDFAGEPRQLAGSPFSEPLKK